MTMSAPPNSSDWPTAFFSGIKRLACGCGPRGSHRSCSAHTNRDGRKPDHKPSIEITSTSNVKRTAEVGPVPRLIDVVYTLTVDGEEKERQDGEPWDWLDPGLHDIAQRMASSLLSRQPGPIDTYYLKLQRLRLLQSGDGEPIAVNAQIVEGAGEFLTKLQLMVAEHVLKKQYGPFYLEFLLEYGRLATVREPGEAYAKTIRLLLDEKMKMNKNWEKRQFISGKDLEHIFTKQAVKRLIDEDDSLSDSGLWRVGPQFLKKRKPTKAEFTKEVFLFGGRLLAICIYTELKLASLYKLMIVDGRKDKDIPIPETDCPEHDENTRWVRVQEVQGSFRPFIFPRQPEHHKVKAGVVVPITFVNRIDKGGFGEVFKVKFHAEYDPYSARPDMEYALRRFFLYGDGTPTQAQFDDEKKVLQILAQVPHAHITEYLGSWTQDGRFYMLFPLAKQNLRNFFRSRPSQESTKAFVLWLFNQMRAIADAVNHIHNLGTSQPDSSSRSKLHPLRHPSQQGWHHDLKPENILVFQNSHEGDIENFVLKVSDFGTARIHRIVSGQQHSHQTEHQGGDPIYGAPDHAQGLRVSRPYDIWSLGCVFLEMITWHFQGWFGVEMFGEARGKHSIYRKCATFWDMDMKTNKVCRHLAVESQLQTLALRCKDLGQFEKLIKLIDTMLSINPEERPRAFEVRNDLETALAQARIDLSSDSDFYTKKHRHQQPIVAGPSTYHPNLSQSSLERNEPSEPPSPRYPNPGHGLLKPRLSGSSLKGMPETRLDTKDSVVGTGFAHRPDHHHSESEPILPGTRSRVPSIHLEGTPIEDVFRDDAFPSFEEQQSSPISLQGTAGPSRSRSMSNSSPFIDSSDNE